VARLDDEGAAGEDLLDALSFLAAHELETGCLDKAEALATRMLDLGGRGRDLGSGIIRDVRGARTTAMQAE
jgi:hypothetical protein